jgi:beta-galactosidase
MNPKKLDTVFPFGTNLCREPVPPMSEVKADMENLKRHGFNVVKLQEHWMTDEPLEGRYDFSRLEELIAQAAGLDLIVYIQMTCEQAPAWLWQKHPDCRMIDINNVPYAYEAQASLPADGKPGPCFDHAGARADQARFIRKMVQTLGAYENIMWNTSQETGILSEPGLRWDKGGPTLGASFCYCPHTIKAFRDWLRETYGDLDALNRAWNTRYVDWELISPERMSRTGNPVDLKWRYFLANVRAPRVLADRAQAVRDADPQRRVVFTHVGSPRIGSGWIWRLARAQDFIGASCYPIFHPTQPWDDGYPAAPGTLDRRVGLLGEIGNVSLEFDYLRSCNRQDGPVWAAELLGGPESELSHRGRTPTPDDMRRWMLTLVGTGMTGICFWTARAEIAGPEAGGFGLLDHEGDTTARYEEASRVGRALNAHPDLFGRPSWPPAPVGILVDERNYQCCATRPEALEHLAYSLRGWHRILWESGVPVDFVEASELDEARVRAHRVLIAPLPLAMSESTAAALARYVEGGGNLISEACIGKLNENSYVNRGELSPAARELFGVRHKALTMVCEPSGAARWTLTSGQRFWGEAWGDYAPETMLNGAGPLQGHRLRANLYLESYECRGSEPCLLWDNVVVGTVRKVNAGRAWLLGTLAGHGGTAHRNESSAAFIRTLLAQCGAAPLHNGKLLLRKRAIPGKEAWLFTNPTTDEITEPIDVAGWKSVSGLLGESLPREGNRVKLTVKGLDIACLIMKESAGQ